MNEIQQKAEEILSISDERYYTISQPEIIGLQSQMGRLARMAPGQRIDKDKLATTPKVLAISAPAMIDKQAKGEFPVLAGVMQSAQRDWEVEFLQNFWFILREERTGNVSVSRPFLWDKRAAIPSPSRSGRPLSEEEAMTSTTSVKRINVIKDLFPNSSWEPGIYHLTAIDYDWVSNSRRVELTNIDRKYPQQITDIEDRIEAFEKAKLQYDAAAGTSSESLSISYKPGACAVSFNMPQQAGIFTTHEGQTYFLCTLLLFKLDSNKPEKLNLAVPAGTQGTQSYQGSFTIDLGKAFEGEELSGSYMAYMVSGPALTGPQVMSIN